METTKFWPRNVPIKWHSTVHPVMNGAFIRNKSVQVHEDTKVTECTKF